MIKTKQSIIDAWDDLEDYYRWQEAFELLKLGEDHFKLILDTDNTIFCIVNYMENEDAEDVWLRFDDFIGNSLGVHILLGSLGVPCEDYSW